MKGPVGEGASSAQVSGTPPGARWASTGTGHLTAAAGNAQVALTWSASTSATSYNVKRSTINGGPYTLIATPTGTTYTNTSLTNNTTYYYVVSAANSGGESAGLRAGQRDSDCFPDHLRDLDQRDTWRG